MSYVYLDHVADIGLQSTGRTFEEALEAAGQGMLDFLVDTSTIEPREQFEIRASASDPGALLVAFLNAVLAEQDISRAFFRTLRVDEIVEEPGGAWCVSATLVGEPIDLSRHDVAHEVKAATYSGLEADLDPGAVRLRCVLDI